MRCPACDTENSELARFCATCGTRLTVVCPHCAAAVSLEARFCTSCGATLPLAEPSGAEAEIRGAGAERRRVSVLFVDLESFTTFAEALDPEEVRAVQSRYFEAARSAVAAFGGTIEKFIGDAVVAVWGAPTAHEDDAERAVRAALEIVAAVPRLVLPRPHRPLAARGAVATGEAAVSFAADGQGMVSGDVINIAARLQGAAARGGVLVDAATRQACAPGSALEFGPIRELELKGKKARVPAFSATLSEARRGGRSAGHAGPFVGRRRELGELTAMFDAVARDRRGRTASVLGIAGIGKSRLAWELEREVTGRAARVEWYPGRTPAYGEGAAFAAVAEMVRRRCGIGDRAQAEVARRQLTSQLDELVRDPDDRSWMEPRLAVLLDASAPRDFEREELFAAWRRFFERVSEQAPTVLVFEDLQWADAGLLDFIEHVGTWSRDYPIMILTLARPELLDARPTWGASQRTFTTLRLDRLSDGSMRELLDDRAHGLPSAALRHVLERAGGIPLYAVELVRMLIDRGELVAGDGKLRVRAPLGGIEVPESLHGILAARVDALPAPERSLLKSAAVLGRRFPPAALAAVSGVQGPELRARLGSLVDRELLTYDDELRSSGHGQIEFLQDLVRELTYRTLPRTERHRAHLRAAAYFDSVDEADLLESTATHLAAAFAADPTSADASAIASRATALLRVVADRALALHAPERALDALQRALGMTPPQGDRRELLELAATAARLAGRLDIAETLLRELVRIAEEGGSPMDRDRLRARLASVLLMAHQNAAALDELERAVEATDRLEGQQASAELMGQLARARLLVGEDDLAVEWADRAIDAAEREADEPAALDALVTRGTGRFRSGAETAGRLDLETAVQRASVAGQLTTELRARNNLAWLVVSDDPRQTFNVAREGVELAERLGVIDWAVQMAELGCLAAVDTGDWDWALSTVARFEEQPMATAYRIDLAATEALIRLLRGEARPFAAIDALEPLDERVDAQDLAGIDHARAWDAWLRADLPAAQELADAAAAAMLGAEQLQTRVLAARSSLWAADVEGLEARLEGIGAVLVGGRAADAARLTLAAGLAALNGDATAHSAYATAAQRWRELDLPVHLALCLAEWHRFGRGDALDEATHLLDGLGAQGLLSAITRARLPDVLSTTPTAKSG